MPGWSDYSNQNIANYMAGAAPFPTSAPSATNPPPIFLALFQVAPTADAGTGATEVPAANGYARQQVAGSLTTSATTASGSAVPAWIVAGMAILDLTTAGVIPAATRVLSTTGTTVTMNANATGGGVGSGDRISFSAFAPATGSTGTNASILPGGFVNTNATITYAQATGAGWGTVQAFGAYDALTVGNFLWWDWLGAFKWIPWSGSSASPCVMTTDLAADVPANASNVVVQQKYGGTLPTTAGSWNGVLTTAGAATNTFNVGVNTTTTGGGLFRQITQQAIAGNVTPSFAAGQLTLTDA